MFRPWLQNYPANISSVIDEVEFESLVDLFENSFVKYANECAFINMDKALSFNDINLHSQYVASYLQQTLQLPKGTRVAIMLPNLLQYPIILLGILRAGMVVVNVNPLYTATELKEQLADSGAQAVFVLANFGHTVQQVIAHTEVKHVVVSNVGDELNFFKCHTANFVISWIKKLVPEYNLPDALSYRDVLRLGRAEQYKRPVIKKEDIAFIQYTGGTTGMAKGAILTHYNMVASLTQADAIFGSSVKETEDTIVTALPLYHAFALTVNCLFFIKKGCANILITNPRDMPAFIKVLKKYPFHYFTGLNTLFSALLDHPDIGSIDFTSLKITLAGGMATHKKVATDWEHLTGSNVIEGYGLTECSPLVSVNLPTSKKFNHSIGLPLPSTDVRLRQEDGTFVEQHNQTGEIEIKGPQVMSAYWNNKSETELVLKHGWFKSGDIGSFDEAGFLHLVERKKDMILVSGFNVYPTEIERVLARLKGISESAAIGVYDAKTGEKVKVFVVLRDHSITIEQIKTHCRKHLSAYKQPKIIELVSALPKNNIGKVLRRLLKEQ